MQTKIIINKIGHLIINIFIWILSISCIYPVFWMIYSSLKTSQEFNTNIITFPKRLNFENYVTAFKTGKFAQYSFNSFFNAIVSLFFILLIAFITAYFISRYEFKGRKLIYMLFMFGMLVPTHALLIPIFVQFKNFGLYNNRLTLIFPYVAFGLPFSIFLMESFLTGVPKELDEAAVIDGSGLARTMFRIIMPVCKPIFIAVGILSFFGNWNELPFALVLTSNEKYRTIALGLQNFKGEFSTDYTRQMAAIVIATLPIIIIYIIFNKMIIQGMTEGAVKG